MSVLVDVTTIERKLTQENLSELYVEFDKMYRNYIKNKFPQFSEVSDTESLRVLDFMAFMLKKCKLDSLNE